MSLPTANFTAVRSQWMLILRRYPGTIVTVTFLHVLATVAGLVAPLLVGRLVDAFATNTATSALINRYIGIAIAAVLLQAGLTKYAQQQSMIFGETVFAELREEYLSTVVNLPLTTVESAGTGDLISRTTTDIDRLADAVRFGLPRLTVALTSLGLILVISAATSLRVTLAILVWIPGLLLILRWYFRRASTAYAREAESYAGLSAIMTETVEGIRTIDALSLGARRRSRLRHALGITYAAERRTLLLRTVMVPGVDTACAMAPVAVVIWGAYLINQGVTTVGTVTTITLLARQLIDPVFELVVRIDQIQLAFSSWARILGVMSIPTDRNPTPRTPEHDQLQATEVTFGYHQDRLVLDNVTLTVRPGERLAIVGPSGAGKSTLGRLLGGVHPPTNGTVTVGDIPLGELDAATLRTNIALITQEHHVFIGSVAENLRIVAAHATTDHVHQALAAVDATTWVQALPEGINTVIGSGGFAITPAQAQQLALARLVLLNPHTVILDEATSLLDSSAARHLEQSLSTVLTGRTVIAIAHRLHTAHDADRVAVIEQGKLSELGRHDDLILANGSYANLWRSWQAG